MKKISVIIPCYNAQTYIRKCLDSLISQTLGVHYLEIIIVNDASTDDTMSVLMEYEARYSESVLIINCEKNGKQGTARNIGLSYASADYVCFVDADDWLESDAFEKMYRKAMKYNCDAVAAGYVEEYNRESGQVQYPKQQDQFYIIENDAERGGFLGIGMGVGFAGNLYRKAMLIENNIYFPEGCLYEDDFWYVLSMHYIKRAYIIGEVFYHYYQHTDSTIHKRNDSRQLDRARVEELKLRELISRGIFQKFPTLYEHEFLYRYYMEMLYVLFVQFDAIPYDTIRNLHDNAYGLFPKYRQNPFVQKILAGKAGAYMKHVYEVLDKEMTKDVIDELCSECMRDDDSWVNVKI